MLQPVQLKQRVLPKKLFPFKEKFIILYPKIIKLSNEQIFQTHLKKVVFHSKDLILTHPLPPPPKKKKKIQTKKFLIFGLKNKFSTQRKYFLYLPEIITNFRNEKILLYLPEKMSYTYPKKKKTVFQTKKTSYTSQRNNFLNKKILIHV